MLVTMRSKRPAKNSKVVTTVVRSATPNMTRNRSSKIPIYRSMSTQPVNKYRLALVDPFDKNCLGVQLPNDFATPTITKVVSGFMYLPASFGNTNSFLFPASPMMSCYAPNTRPTSTDMIPYSQFTAITQAIDQATLRSNFTSWRVVAGGIRIKSGMAPTSAPIVCSIASVPTVGSGPGPNYLNTVGPQTTGGIINIISDIIGVGPALVGGWNSAMNGFSNFSRFTTQDVATQSLTIPFRVTDSRAFDFKNSLSNVGSGYTGTSLVADQLVYNLTTNTVITGANDNEENYSFEGFSAITLDIKSAPTVLLPTALEVEYIYHLEGIPATNQNTTANAIASSASAAPTSNHLMDIAWANRQGLYKIADSMVGTLFAGTTPRLVKTLLGLME